MSYSDDVPQNYSELKIEVLGRNGIKLEVFVLSINIIH
jgi:hypothetical protein